MSQSKITSKNQITLPKPIREVLGVKPGDRVRFFILDNGQVRIAATRPLSELHGILKYEGPPISLEDMEKSIVEGASDTWRHLP